MTTPEKAPVSRRLRPTPARFTVVLFAGVAAVSPANGGGPPLPCHKCDSAVVCEGDGNQATPPPVQGGGGDASATDVQHVELDVALNFTTQTISGTCTHTIQSLEDGLAEYYFRLNSALTITSARLNGVTPVTVEQVSDTTRRAILDQPYDAGAVFTLSIGYNGPTQNQGFGSFTWSQHNGTNIASSLSEPYFAETWWPCKDGDVAADGDNSDKFTTDLYVTVPATMQVPSNGMLQSIIDLPGSKKQYHWSTVNPLSTYLVSLAATNYNSWTVTYTYPGGTMPVQFYLYPEDDTPAHRAEWEKSLDMLAAFRTPFGEYPFIDEKYGIYEFPFGGGMEHQTMTGQGGVTLNPSAEYITAHELAHQWWGDMITCRTWHDIWLNEGFATYSEAIWEEFQPGGSFAAYRAHMNARRPGSVGGTVYRYDVSNIGSIFSGTYAYNKGAWVLHMLRHVVGDQTFFDILANYRAAYQYQSAVTDDFAAVCSATHGSDLSWYFTQWVYDGGAPSCNWGAQAVQVNGQHYLLLKIQQTQQASWGVFDTPLDIRYTSGSDTVTRSVWNNGLTEYYTLAVGGPAAASVQLDPDDWVLIVNKTQSAYQPGPPTIVAASPAPGAALPGTVQTSSVSVTFHTPVTTSAAHYTLVGANTGPRPVTFLYNSDTQTASLSSATPLPNDHYTLTVSQSIAADNSGMMLDGELPNPSDPASLPTGDGQPGGAAVIEFDIVRDPADINNDQALTAADVSLFVAVLLGEETNSTYVANSDLNGDASADAADIAPFVDGYFP